MKQYLKRLAAGVVVSYANGVCSTSLQGTDFSVETPDEGILLSLDISGNLEDRNHDLPCHRDAALFLRWHEQVRSIQIEGPELAHALSSIIGEFPADRWFLDLRLKRSFRYSVTPRASEWNVAFLAQEKTTPAFSGAAAGECPSCGSGV